MTALSRGEAVAAGSNQQMHRKMTSLKSPLFCTEKLDRVQTTLDSSLHWPEGLKGEEIKKYSREGDFSAQAPVFADTTK